MEAINDATKSASATQQYKYPQEQGTYMHIYVYELMNMYAYI